MPKDSKFLTVAGPNKSLPTLATMATEAPHRRAATAWLAPFPPNPRSNFFPKIVSPGRGNVSLKIVRSTLALPTTTISFCMISPWGRYVSDLRHGFQVGHPDNDE